MELLDQLIRELGVSTRQAEGGVGLLLALAQQRLTDEEFVQLANTIPAISDVIGKAPRPAGRPVGPVRELLSRWFSGLGGLAGVAPRFERLGCDKTMVPRFADEVARFFQERHGEELSTLLRRAFR